MMKTLIVLSITAILVADPTFAHNGEHAAGEQHTVSTAQDVKGLWQKIVALQVNLTTTRPEGMHEPTEKLVGLLTELKAVTTGMSEARRIRFHAALDQAISATNDLHEAADGGNTSQTTERQTRMTSALKLVEAIGGADIR